MMWSKSRAVLFCLCWFFASRATARAEGGSSGTVVMFVDEGVVPLARRVRQEIESLGLTVKVNRSEAVAAPSLEAEARAAGAVAAIRVSPAGGGAVEMTIVDRGAGKSVTRRLVVAAQSDPSAVELIATRTVELLRASLIELAAPPPAAKSEAPPRREMPAPALAREEPMRSAERAASFSMLAGPALVHSADFRPGLHLLADVSYVSPYRVGVSVAALLPLVPARLTTQEGHVDLSAALYRLSAVFEAGAASWPLSVRLSAGLAMAQLHLRGSANAPNVSASDDRVAWSPSAGVALRFRLGTDVNLVTEAMALLGYPRTVVRVADREATAWGRPAAAGSIGLELSWPWSGARARESAATAARGAR